ncbi:MAG: hypothetical protein AAF943_12955 [Pseudomonadota bacterium]
MATLFLLGVTVCYTGLSQDLPILPRSALVLLGLVALWGARATYQATSGSVELTKAGLRDSDGGTIVPLENIRRVERGMLAFKPSNGFMIHTRDRQSRGWRYGLWWRVGRHVGVGGMMPARETKAMAIKLEELLQGEHDR